MKPKQEIENDDGDCDGLLGFDESTSGFNTPHCSANSTALTSTTPQYFRWTPESTKMMLTMRFNMETHFSQRLRQKKDLWNEIATEMGRMGDYLITGEACDLKFRNMLQTFKKNRIKEERGMNDLIIWEYYTLFKEAMLNSGDRNDGDAATNEQVIPSMLCESLVSNGEDTNNDITQNLAMDQQISGTTDAHKAVNQKTMVYIEQPKDSPKQLSKRPRLCSIHSQTDQESVIYKSLPTLGQTITTQLVQQSPKQQSLWPPEALITQSPCQSREPTIPLTNISQTTLTSWLSPTEFKECEVFGQSVGCQLANVRDIQSRALLKLKIQQLFFLASTGKLSEDQN